MEAMAREKCVIASDIPAHRDLIINGKNGFLFKVGDEKSLAGIINNLRGKKKIGINARKSVEIFKWSKIISKIEKLFN
jgi:glycosyltransferase involved in cell wall biosynthesis